MSGSVAQEPVEPVEDASIGLAPDPERTAPDCDASATSQVAGLDPDPEISAQDWVKSDPDSVRFAPLEVATVPVPSPSSTVIHSPRETEPVSDGGTAVSDPVEVPPIFSSEDPEDDPATAPLAVSEPEPVDEPTVAPVEVSAIAPV